MISILRKIKYKKYILLAIILLALIIFLILYFRPQRKNPVLINPDIEAQVPNYFTAENSEYDNQTYSSIKNGYQDYWPISNYVRNGYAWNDPVFAPYTGIDTSNDQDLINFVQNTQVKHLMLSFATVADGHTKIDFPDGTSENYIGPQDSNMISWGNSNKAGTILPHWDIIKQLRNLGVDVGFGFGGSGDSENLFRFGSSIASLARWYEDVILGYGIHNVDWDIEGKAVNDTYDINRLAKSIHLIVDDLNHRNYHLKIKFTLQDNGYKESWMQNIDNELSNNYLINIMDPDIDISEMTDWLKTNLASFKNESTLEIHHRIGLTNPFFGDPLFDPWKNLTDIENFINNAIDEQLGYISFFEINKDLAENSYDNWPGHSNNIDINDYDTTKLFTKFEINKNWNHKSDEMNGKIENFHVYYAIKNDPDNSQYLGSCIKWNEVLNADYYQVIFNDHDKEITYETTRTNIFLPTDNASDYSVEIIAHNVNNDQTITSNKLDFSVADNALNQPLHYYDITANLWTGTGPKSDFYSQGKGYLNGNLFYCKNKIYELINNQYGNYLSIHKTDREKELPDKNKTSFKLSGFDINSTGYSKEAINDLNNFQILSFNQFLQFDSGNYNIYEDPIDDNKTQNPLINGYLYYKKYKYN